MGALQLKPSVPNPLLAGLVLAMLVSSAFGSRHRLLQRAIVQFRGPNATEEFLLGQNRARATVHLGPLKWSQKLAKEASRLVTYQRDKRICQFANLSSSEYGANQARGSYPMSPRQAVDLWVSQMQFYNHTKNLCAPTHDCSVYTQVVWKRTLEVGCAQASCVKEATSLAICFYFPPGNVEGESPY